MKRILLLLVAITPFGMLHSQNVNYTVEIVEYFAADGCPSDGFGFDEEVTWKCWGMDDGNVPAMIGGTCEGWDNNVQMNFTGFISTVLLNETNTPATNITLQLEAWEDDNFSNAVGSVDRCSFDSGDDCHINIVFPAFNFRNDPHCQWNEYSFNYTGDFGVTVRVKWEYTDFSVQTPISGCNTQAQLSAEGSGEWTIVSGVGGSFTSNFDPNALMNGSTGETYQITWSVSGCISNFPTENVTVDMFPEPVPNLSTASALCENSDLVFTASNGINYVWSTGTVGNIIDTTANGLDTIFNITSSDLPVFVTVTDGNGCSATDSITFPLLTGPLVDLGNDTSICPGTSAQLDAFVGGINSYSWNNGETNSIISAFTPGEYIIEVEDLFSNCFGYDTIQIGIYPISPPNLGSNVDLCDGDTIILDAGGEFTSYLWSSGSTNQTDTILTPGNVIVTVSDTNTCTLKDTIKINSLPIPTLNLNTTSNLCENTNLIFTANNGVNYIWSTGSIGNVVDTTINGLFNLTNVSSGDLPVFVTALGSNGCSATESITFPLLTGPLVDLGSDTSICPGTTALLNAFIPGVNSYNWNNGETDSVITISNPGEYVVKVTDFASGCSGNDTIQVSLFPNSTLDLGTDIEFCIGDTIILDAGINFASYLWSSGSTNQIDTMVNFGSLFVTVTDTNTCTLTDIINFSPTYTYYQFASDTTIFLGNSIVLTSPTGNLYTWNTGETTQEITVSPSENTNYSVTIELLNGCFEIADVNVLINENLNFFIPTMFSPNNDLSNDIFLIYGNGVETINFSIYNRWGEIVFESNEIEEMLTIGWDGTDNGIEQPIGTYIWKMSGFTLDGESLQFEGRNTGTILLKR